MKTKTTFYEQQAVREGWSLFNVDGRIQLQRLDAIEISDHEMLLPLLASDADALQLVASKSSAGSQYHRLALTLVGTLADNVAFKKQPPPTPWTLVHTPDGAIEARKVILTVPDELGTSYAVVMKISADAVVYVYLERFTDEPQCAEGAGWEAYMDWSAAMATIASESGAMQFSRPSSPQPPVTVAKNSDKPSRSPAWELTSSDQLYYDFERVLILFQDKGETSLDARLTFNREDRTCSCTIVRKNDDGNTAEATGDHRLSWEAGLDLLRQAGNVIPDALEVTR